MITKPFQIDPTDQFQRHHIIGDVNDHLLDAGLDGDAQNFLYEVQGLNPDKDFDAILAIVFEYVDVEDVSDSRHPYIQNEPDDVEPLTWDKEAELVKQSLADSPTFHAPHSSSYPVDLMVPEFPELSVVWDFEAPLDENMKAVLLEITSLRDARALRSFIQDWRGLKSHTWTYKAMFQLAWSYVTIYPEPSQYGSDDW